MTSTSAVTLSVSIRDLQYLVTAHAAMRSLVMALAYDTVPEGTVQNNIDALLELHETHYSGDESNALMQRLRALLPLDSPVCVVQGFPLASASTLVQ